MQARIKPMDPIAKNKPQSIPKGTGDNIVLIEIPLSVTPALAKANKGIIPKATYGDNICSNLSNSEKSLLLFL